MIIPSAVRMAAVPTIVGLLALTLTAACTGPPAQSGTTTPKATAGPVTSSPAVPAGGESPQSGPFGKPLTFTDGLSVRVAPIEHRKAGTGNEVDGVAAGEPVVKLTVIITAGRVGVTEPQGLGNLTYGDTGIQAKQINEGDETGPLTAIPAGTAKTSVWTFVVPLADQGKRAVFTFTVDASHEADFVGSIK